MDTISANDTLAAENGAGCPRTWWNGYVVFVLSKG